jgi:hypothetical protein
VNGLRARVHQFSQPTTGEAMLNSRSMAHGHTGKSSQRRMLLHLKHEEGLPRRAEERLLE